MGNPKRRRSHRRTRRSRRSSSRSLFRNPIGGSISAVSAPVREMASVPFLLEVTSLAGGFVLPGIVTNRFVPLGWRNTALKGYAVKVGVIAGLSALAGLKSRKLSRAVLVGGGISLVLDLYTDFAAPAISGVLGRVSSAPALPAPAGGAATYFGDRGMGTFYGDEGLGSFEGSSIGAAFGGGVGDAMV